MTSPSTEAEPRHRPRITHLVLVDGLPADHWVEEVADVGPVSRPGRGPVLGRGAQALTSRTDQRRQELDWLEALVGGAEALLALDDLPLQRRALELPELGPEPTRRAVAIATEAQRLAVEVFDDDELEFAVARLWEGLLRTDPAMLARSARDDTAVGALVWVVAQANGLLGPEGRLLARDLWPRLGVPASAAGRGSALLERLAPGTAHLAGPPGAPRLRPTGRPDVLLTPVRSLLVARRDQLAEVLPGSPARPSQSSR